MKKIFLLIVFYLCFLAMNGQLPDIIFRGVGIPKKENQPSTLSYEKFVMPIVNAMQKQDVIINKQK